MTRGPFDDRGPAPTDAQARELILGFALRSYLDNPDELARDGVTVGNLATRPQFRWVPAWRIREFCHELVEAGLLQRASLGGYRLSAVSEVASQYIPREWIP